MVNQPPHTASHGSLKNIIRNKDFSNLLGNSERKQVWLPAQIHADGTLENILQGTVVNDGPQKGHWAVINGKRKWIEGQHNYNRQRNPRNPDEAVIGTKVMNTNPRIQIESGLDEDGKSYLVDNARIIRLGRTVTRHETFFDKGFDDSLKRARRIVNAANEVKAKVGASAGVGSKGVLRK